MTIEAQTNPSLTTSTNTISFRTAPISDGDAELVAASVFGGDPAGCPTRPAAQAAGARTASGVSAGAKAPSSAKPENPALVGGRSRFTYVECLKGAAPVPAGGPGKGIFQLLMVGGMVSVMATFTGVLHNGTAFFATAHWMYPLVFCLALLVRLAVADKAVGYVAPRVIFPRFKGVARGVAMTLLNVAVMGSIMGSVMTFLLNGADNYLYTVATTLPVTMTFASLANFFVVGPVVKMLHHNVIGPNNGLRIFTAAQRYARPLTAIFGN